MKGDRERCLAAGMDEYVSKPIKSPDLQRAMDAVIPKNHVGQAIRLPANAEARLRNGHSPNGNYADPAFDRGALWNYVDGDKELLEKIIERFEQSSSSLVERVRESIAKNDFRDLEFSAHTLKGAVGNFFAASAYDAAYQMEEIGRGAKMAEASPALARLEREIERLREDLAMLRQEAAT
jgi:HPt (histidine-containing phosphotransfer) domain-containing protein